MAEKVNPKVEGHLYFITSKSSGGGGGGGGQRVTLLFSSSFGGLYSYQTLAYLYSFLLFFLNPRHSTQFSTNLGIFYLKSKFEDRSKSAESMTTTEREKVRLIANISHQHLVQKSHR